MSDFAAANVTMEVLDVKYDIFTADRISYIGQNLKLQ
jgi:hypothetical protein